MTNEELKKKICKIIAPYISAWGDDERIADALIAAGVVDKSDYASMKETAVRYKAEVSKAEARAKEAEHRAEVAEQALRNAAPRLNCHGGLGKGFCRVDKCDYYHCSNDEGCVKAHLQQAEKELAEERKDD